MATIQTLPDPETAFDTLPDPETAFDDVEEPKPLGWKAASAFNRAAEAINPLPGAMTLLQEGVSQLPRAINWAAYGLGSDFRIPDPGNLAEEAKRLGIVKSSAKVAGDILEESRLVPRGFLTSEERSVVPAIASEADVALGGFVSPTTPVLVAAAGPYAGRLGPFNVGSKVGPFKVTPNALGPYKPNTIGPVSTAQIVRGGILADTSTQAAQAGAQAAQAETIPELGEAIGRGLSSAAIGIPVGAHMTPKRTPRSGLTGMETRDLGPREALLDYKSSELEATLPKEDVILRIAGEAETARERLQELRDRLDRTKDGRVRKGIIREIQEAEAKLAPLNQRAMYLQKGLDLLNSLRNQERSIRQETLSDVQKTRGGAIPIIGEPPPAPAGPNVINLPFTRGIRPGYQAAGEPKQGGQISFAAPAEAEGIPSARQAATPGRVRVTDAETEALQKFIDEEAAKGAVVTQDQLPEGVTYRRPQEAPSMEEYQRRVQRENVETGLTSKSGYYVEEPTPAIPPAPERGVKQIVSGGPPPPAAPVVLSNLQRARLRNAVAQGKPIEVLLNILRTNEKDTQRKAGNVERITQPEPAPAEAPALEAPAAAGAAPAESPRMAAFRRIVEEAFPHLTNLVKANVVRFVEDASQFPDWVKQQAGDAVGEINAFYDTATRQVVFNAGRLAGMDEATIRGIVTHEVAIHKGLRAAMGEEPFNRMAEWIWDNLEDAQRGPIRELHGEKPKAFLGEEWLADEAERVYKTGVPSTTWTRAANLIRQGLRKLGIKLELTDTEIADMVYRGWANVEAENAAKAAEIPNPETAISASRQGSDPAVLNHTKGVGTARFSLASWNRTDKTAMFKDLVVSGIADPVRARKWIDDIDSIAAIIARNREQLDYQGADAFLSLKQNADVFYKLSEDYSTICRKGGKLLATISKIMVDTRGGMTAADMWKLRDMLRERGEDVTCAACYVWSRKIQVGAALDEIARTFPEVPREIIYDPTRSDILKTKYPAAWKLLKKKGSGVGKAFEVRTEYNREVLKLSPAWVKRQNMFSGLRSQSWSDFEIYHLIDKMQSAVDKAQKGLMGHSYTKVPEYVRLAAPTGEMVNMSLIPKGTGLDANGELIFDGVEGMPAEASFSLRRSHRNAGTVTIGVTDAQIIKAQADPRIDDIIGYHASGLRESLRNKSEVKDWTDYSDIQHEGVADQAKFDKYKAWKKSKGFLSTQTEVRPWEYWDKNADGDTNAKNYLAYCKENGITPKFEKFSKYPGYWKHLIDRRMYDNEGKYIEQQVVKPTFDMEAINDMIRRHLSGEWEGVADTTPSMEVYNEFMRGFRERNQQQAQTIRGFREAEGPGDVIGEGEPRGRFSTGDKGERKTKWVKEEGEPFYKSEDGRFEISPLYLGRERPQGWEVRDNETKQTERTYNGLSNAKEIVQKMINPPRQKPALELTQEHFQNAYDRAISMGSIGFAQKVVDAAKQKGFDIGPKAEGERGRFSTGDKGEQKADYDRYKELTGSLRGKTVDEAQAAMREVEGIKNKYGGKPPPEPPAEGDRGRFSKGPPAGASPELKESYSKFEPPKKQWPKISAIPGKVWQESLRGLSSKYQPWDALAGAVAKDNPITTTKITPSGTVSVTTPRKPMKIAAIFEQLKGSGGKAENQIYNFDRDVTKKLGGKEADFNVYMFLSRTLNRLQQDLSQGTARRQVKGYTIGGTRAQLAELQNLVGPETWGRMTDAGRKYGEYMDEALRQMVYSGRMTREMYRKIKDENEFYAPFFIAKFIEEQSRPEGVGSRVDTRAKFTKAMEGITDENFKLMQMVPAAKRAIYMSRILADKAFAMRYVADLATQDVSGTHIRRLFPTQKPRTGYAVVTAFENGKEVRYEVPEAVAQSIQTVGGNSANIISQALSGFGKVFRISATTANIPFQFSNLAADIPRTALVSKYGLRHWTDPIVYPMELFEAFSKAMGYHMFGVRTKLMQDFFDSGAAGTTIQEYLTDGILKRNPYEPKGWARKYPGSILEKMADFSTAIEQTSKVLGIKRAMRFEGAGTGLELQRNVPQAVTEVRRYSGSPDFGRVGAWTEQAKLNILFMFLNARMQGAFADIGRLIGKQGAGMASLVWGRLIGTVGLGTALLYYLNQDSENKEDYDKRPKYEKDNYWLIPKPGKRYITNEDGEKVRDYWKMPKRESAKWVGNATEAFLKFAEKKDPQAFKDLGVKLMEDISPLNIEGKTFQERLESVGASLNPMLKAPLELGTGRNLFRHRTVVPEYMKGASPELQFKETTSPLFTWAADKMPDILPSVVRSPLMLENLTRNLTAGLITQFTKGRDIKERSWFENLALLQRYQALPYTDTEPIREEIANLERESVDEFLIKHRYITKLIEDNPNTPIDLLMEKMGDRAEDVKYVRHLVDVMLQKEAGVTAVDKMLIGLPLEQRTKWLMDKMDKLKTVEEREDFVIKMAQKRVWTEGVSREMGRMLMEREQK